MFTFGPHQASSADPYWNNVVLLTHFDSAFVDDSSYHHALTASGAVSISGASYKFGGASAYYSIPYPSSTGVVFTGASADFNLSGDFTIEGWVLFGGVVDRTFFTVSPDTASIGPKQINFARTSGALTVGAFNQNLASGVAASTSVWYYVALVRSGSALTFYVNGTAKATATSSSAFLDSCAVAIGASADHANLHYGNLDEWRITRGVARYSADFTPPSSQFP